MRRFMRLFTCAALALTFTLPVSTRVAGAQTRQEAALWDSIKDSRNVEDFRGYLDKYPDGTFAPVAKRRISSLQDQAREEMALWNHIKDSNDPDDFQEYVEKFPQGSFASTAQRRISELTAAIAREASKISLRSMITDAGESCTFPDSGRTHFSVNTSRVWVFVKYAGGFAGDQASFDWIDPSGNIYITNAPKAPQSGNGGNWQWCYFIAIAGYPPANEPGLWTVRFNWNGLPVAKRTFSVAP